MADTEFLDITMNPEALEAFAKPEPNSTPLVVQHHHGFITAQKVDQPRDDSKVLAKMKVLAQMAGDFYYYEWNTNNRDGTKGIVSGGTIKLANDLARTYGNCVNTIDCRMVDQYLLFKARFTDLESGYSLERMFQQRMAQNIGTKMDAERQRDIVFQIGQSKAIRNVTLNALQTFADYAVEEARQSLVDKFGKDIKGFQEKARSVLEDLGIPLINVERVLARPIVDWRARDLARVRANLNSIRDGMATKEELFPSHAASAPSMDSDNLAKEANDAAAAKAAGAPNPKETGPKETIDPDTGEIKTETTKPAAEPEPEKEKPAAAADKKPAKKAAAKKEEPEPKAEPAAPEAEKPKPAKVEDKPAAAAPANDADKAFYDGIVARFNLAIAACEKAGNNDPLYNFNDTMLDDRKLIAEPYKVPFRDMMKAAWARDFTKAGE